MRTLIDKQIMTRKPHHCWGCAREFPIGTRMRYIVAVTGDGFGSSYWCPVCEEVLRECDCNDGGEYDYGEVKNYDIWDETQQELENDVELRPSV